MFQTELAPKRQAHARNSHRNALILNGGRVTLDATRRMPGSPISRAIVPNRRRVTGSSAKRE
jgi:hypothetical protein